MACRLDHVGLAGIGDDEAVVVSSVAARMLKFSLSMFGNRSGNDLDRL